MEFESRQIENGSTSKAVLPELSALDLLKGSYADNGLKYGMDARPKTPMLDELNRRTTALEKNISETAKKDMTPLQIAQLESGAASSALKSQYESQLIATVAQYERNGSVPKDVYAAVIAGAKQERILDEQQAAKDKKAGERLLSGFVSERLPLVTIFDDRSPAKPYGDPTLVGRPGKGEDHYWLRDVQIYK